MLEKCMVCLCSHVATSGLSVGCRLSVSVMLWTNAEDVALHFSTST